MNYIKKIAKRILAKDYDVVKKPALGKRAIFPSAIFPNGKCFELIKHKKYKHFLLFYIVFKRYDESLRKPVSKATSTGLLYEVAKLYGIKNITAKYYTNEMLKDKVLIGANKVIYYNQIYSFNPEYFDTYLLTDYKTLEE